ncbi:MAG: bis-aminopropyl spermidine synthase family protein [Ezakiella sp.]|nr:bis-aminopropyl spermidine synthase family protein [Ezakiella sp.]
MFLGDGDGMSSSLVLFSEAGIIPKIKSATVLDFDERILNGILRCRDKHGVKIEMNLELYNVIEPIPKKYQGKFDFFYINPPYGSKNEGLSSIVWLYRCMDLIKKDAEGIIVIPYDSNIEWTKDAMVKIQKFLIDNGFVLKK